SFSYTHLVKLSASRTNRSQRHGSARTARVPLGVDANVHRTTKPGSAPLVTRCVARRTTILRTSSVGLNADPRTPAGVAKTHYPCGFEPVHTLLKWCRS